MNALLYNLDSAMTLRAKPTSIGSCPWRRKIPLGVHGDMNEIVTILYVDDEIDESRRRAQSTGLQAPRPTESAL